MQLEQQLYEVPKASERKSVTYFTTRDLEGLSSSALYTGDLPPMGPGNHGVPTRKSQKVSEEWDLPMYGGGPQWTKSTDYVKDTEAGQLHVHAPNGMVTGAKIDGRPISNYEAAMLDLLPGKVHKDTGKF